MRKGKKFIRKLIRSRWDIPGYKEDSVEEAMIKASSVLEKASTISVEELKETLPNPLNFIAKTGSWKTGDIFLRSRLMGVTIDNLKKAGHWRTSAFWEAPADKIKNYGRLNEPGESIFYLSNNPLQTFKEIRYQVKENRDQAVILNSYKVKKDFSATIIGQKFENATTSDQVYANMIYKLFSYPSELYGENVYKLSNFLSNFYNYLPKGPKVFAYPAVGESDESIINLAFEPNDAHEYLEYNGSIVIPDYKHTDLSNFTISLANDKYFQIADESVDVLPWVRDNFLLDFTGEN